MDDKEREIALLRGGDPPSGSRKTNNANNNALPVITATPLPPGSTAFPSGGLVTAYASSNNPATAGGGQQTFDSSVNCADEIGASFPVSQTEALERDQVMALKAQGFPTGLALELGNTRRTYPIRFWVVDNSGSMRTNDGHQIRGDDAESVRVVDCTRWRELQGAVEYHAELAGLLQATTLFRLLNHPVGPDLSQEFTVAETTSNTTEAIRNDVERAKNIIRRTDPRGVTPLTDHLRVIRMRLQAISGALQSQGQQAVIILATDGLPSDEMGESTRAVLDEFINCLRALQSLPVWVVVRLCTDDDKVVDYYNDLDQILELPLEVIDDFFGEAKEIRRANKWLNYALPLHRCREMGYHHRIFDLLDERLLNKDELLVFLQLLFGKSTLEGIPDPHADWSGFVDVVARVVHEEGKHWNPATKKLDYWIDMKQLEKKYGRRNIVQRIFS